jgi:hypothetical protein
VPRKKKGRSGPGGGGGRVTPKGTRPGENRSAASGPDLGLAGEPDLLREVRRALADEDPLALLALVSSILTTVDPRRIDPFDDEDDVLPEGLTAEALVTSFAGIDRRETSALLVAIAELSPDDLIVARARRALDARQHSLPLWLTGLHDARAYSTVEMVHVLGDGDNVMVGLRLVGGMELTFVVYIDHNVGTLVKDAFVVPETIDKLIRFMKSASDDVDTVWRPLDPAEARARIVDGIALAAMTYPPFESETWPLCRPLVEWVAAKLPPGGTGYRSPDWSDDALDAIADRFFASSFGADLDDDDARDLLDHILWFSVEDGPGDPLRWSPVAVELFMVHWFPRNVSVPVGDVSRLPDVLRAFVAFAHHERGIRPALTAETLEAVDRWEPAFDDILDELGPELADYDDVDDDLLTEDEFARIVRLGLAMQVGGEEALDSLSPEPLPDEPFRWEGIADDIRQLVGEVLVLTDGWCDAVGDVEYRTACRRFLAASATRSAGMFRGSARADTTAAATAWAVGRANDRFSRYEADKVLVKDLLAHFGLRRSVAPRAYTMLRAGGFDHGGDMSSYTIVLGSPDFLTSTRRRWIAEARDRMLALLEDGDPER